MSRVALVAPAAHLRAMLIAIADAGTVQLVGPLPAPQGEAVEALRRLERAQPQAQKPAPRLAETSYAVDELERAARRDLLAGEVELQRRAEAAVRRRRFAAVLAWAPTQDLPALRERLAKVGAAAIELRRPLLVEPPTLLRPPRLMRPFQPLVDTYGAARYGDLDPTSFAAVTFVFMFGMMFGDAGDGLLLAALGLLLRRSRSPRFARLRPLWPFPVACGLAATVFGLLYGEAFGPTGIVPTLWLAPLDEPVRLLAIAVTIGALLLAVGYAIGIVNRWREGGPRAALLAPSGIAGFSVFAGAGVLALGAYAGSSAVLLAGTAIVIAGAALLFAGFAAESGTAGAAVQAPIEVFDAVVRVGANLISFTRLAAFGLMHAALAAVVLDGARGLWSAGAGGRVAAIIVFTVGHVGAFALEALVAGVQAMRLEYYELFSRLFAGEGEPFRPWRIPVVRKAVPT
ncbi:MAG TPA: V-type ATPase 116kDa subunit family protein [Solirubrobacteraceae bacterium]